MQGRGIQPTLNIRLVTQVFVALFVISFGGLLLQLTGAFRQKVEQEEVVADLSLHGVVISMKDDRFLHTQNVLTSLGITVARKVPQSYLSKEVDQGLERFAGSRVFHTDTFLKVWSNRMTFIDALEEFAQDPRCTRNTWRFFFEDDIAMHPNVTSERARALVAKGLKLADEDGILYLGICGPNCSDPPSPLDEAVEAARCAGTCAHAFGFQRWKAGQFLSEMSALSFQGSLALGFYFDRYMYEYGNQVQKIWVVGSNLKSPVEMVWDHFGLLFQDRALYPSSIG